MSPTTETPMKRGPVQWLRDRFENLGRAFTRYPLTALLLIAAALVMIWQIEFGQTNRPLHLGFLIGAALATCARAAVENRRLGLPIGIGWQLAAVLPAVGSFFWLRTFADQFERWGVVVAVILWALWFLFVLIPTMRKRVDFSDAFMWAFKAFFLTLLFAGVLFGGCGLTLVAIDQLIRSVPGEAYQHMINIVFGLFAPLFFLAQTPSAGRDALSPAEETLPQAVSALPEANEKAAAETAERQAGVSAASEPSPAETIPAGETVAGAKAFPEERAERDLGEIYREAAAPPRFLQILISYIVIPLIAAFTLILVLYAVLNLRGQFWTDNRLEPLLIAYSAVGLLVFLLSGRIENRFSHLYRMIFPKVLLPLVILQLIASAMKAGEVGLTYGRYFVLFYGGFALVAGLIGSLFQTRRNRLIVGLLVVCLLVSVLPPLDAFSVSGRSQINRLGEVLTRNQMIDAAGSVRPGTKVSEEDRRYIATAVAELERSGMLKQVRALPKNFNYYRDFETTFGFPSSRYPAEPTRWVYLSRMPDSRVNVSGYQMIVTQIELSDSNTAAIGGKDIELGGAKYRLFRRTTASEDYLALLDDGGRTVAELNLKGVAKGLADVQDGGKAIPADQLFFESETEAGGLAILLQDINIEKGSELSYRMMADVFIRIGSQK